MAPQWRHGKPATTALIALLAVVDGGATPAAALLANADRTMHRAKHAGGNQVGNLVGAAV